MDIEVKTKSEMLFERAQEIFPGGVNSPVRAFKAVGGTPPFIERAEGPFLFDVDGNRYVDYVLSYGPMILGTAIPTSPLRSKTPHPKERVMGCRISFHWNWLS